MSARTWMCAAAAAVSVVGAASAQPGAAEVEHARPRLIAETGALAPGKTNYLALTFEIDPHWHLYWKGVNDTGFAPTLDLKAPPGYTVGEVQWPAPKRLVLPGEILDHVYEERVTLIVPVQVPKDASGTAEFSGSSEWLVCEDVCIPGSGEVSLKVPVDAAGSSKSGPDARLFAEAQARIPKELPKENPPLTTVLDNDVFVIKSSIGKEMAFYPGEGCAELADPIKDGATDTGALRLRLADLSMNARVKGVVEVKPGKPGEPASIYAVDFPIASPGRAPLAAPTPTR